MERRAGRLISYINWKEKVKSLSRVQLFATPWTPPSMEFSRQEYWRGLPFPSPQDLPDPGIKPRSPAFWADAFTVWATREAPTLTEAGNKSAREENWGHVYCECLWEGPWLRAPTRCELHGSFACPVSRFTAVSVLRPGLGPQAVWSQMLNTPWPAMWRGSVCAF